MSEPRLNVSVTGDERDLLLWLAEHEGMTAAAIVRRAIRGMFSATVMSHILAGNPELAERVSVIGREARAELFGDGPVH